MDKLLKDHLGLFPIAMWLLSLVLPAVGWGDDHPAAGVFVLMIGWLGALNLQFGWLANVAFIISIPIVLGRWRPSTLTILLLILGILFPTMQAFTWQKVHSDQGNFAVVIGVGYYVWVTAMFGQVACLGFELSFSSRE